MGIFSNWGLTPKTDEIIVRQERNIRGSAHFILVLTPGCLDAIIQVNDIFFQIFQIRHIF